VIDETSVSSVAFCETLTWGVRIDEIERGEVGRVAPRPPTCLLCRNFDRSFKIDVTNQPVHRSSKIVTPEEMKKIIYWTATGIIAAVMLCSALNFSLNKEMEGAFAHLGLPNWFRVELTVAKILGSLALLIPTIPNRIKEFAYFGFAITLISAIIAHSSSGDGLASLDPLVFLAVLVVSYWYYHKDRDAMTRIDRRSSTIDVSGPGNPMASPGRSA